MKSKKRILTSAFFLFLSISMLVTVAAVSSNGSPNDFIEDSINYSTYSTIYVTTSAYARQLVAANTSRPAGYLYAQAVLMNEAGALVATSTTTNLSVTDFHSVYAGHTYDKGNYYAQGGAMVWRNGSYSSFYIGGRTVYLTLQ